MEQVDRFFVHLTEDVITGIVWLLLQFELRALMLAKPNDHVIFIACSEERENILAQQAFLFSIGMGPKRENVHFGLQDLPPGTQLDVFSGTSEKIRTLAARYQHIVKGPSSESCWRANDKVVMRLVCENDEEMRDWIPYGHVTIREHLVEKIVDVFSHAEVAVVKDPTSASGLNQKWFRRGEKIELPEWVDSCDRFVVEAFVFEGVPEHDVMDVSAQLYVPKLEGKALPDLEQIEALTILCQHVEQSHHCGNWGPAHISLSGKRGITKNLSKEVERRARKFVREHCRETGYWGPGSIDLKVRRSTKEMFILDPNMRITAPSYVLKSQLNAFGEIRFFDMRSFEVPLGMSFKDILTHFSDSLYDPKTEEGFVPFCFISDTKEKEEMRKCGFCYGVVFAKTRESLLDRVDQVESRKEGLVIKLDLQRRKIAYVI